MSFHLLDIYSCVTNVTSVPKHHSDVPIVRLKTTCEFMGKGWKMIKLNAFPIFPLFFFNMRSELRPLFFEQLTVPKRFAAHSQPVRG